ncbi:MAG: NUDIX domain-containing protein, partial [Thermomicrobiales bacterium]
METALEAARREAFEEAGIPANASFLRLDTTASIRVTCFPESEIWGKDRFVVPEHAFGVEVASERVSMSTEHVDVRWLPFADAEALLRFDSNRTALWELNQRVRGLGPR